jgi:superfamily II DNA or RNA helicase
VKLRPYQGEAVAAIKRDHRTRRSVCIVQATGTGKTLTFCWYAAREMTSDRVLIVVHRSELIRQTVETLERLGETPDVEQGDRWSAPTLFGGGRIVVGTVQSISRPNRLLRYDPAEFGLIVWDECHRCIDDNEQYAAIRRKFAVNPRIRELGATATPMRADKKTLSQWFETESYSLPLGPATDAGWLVPFRQKFVTISGIDWSSLVVRNGEFTGTSVEHAMRSEQSHYEIAGAARDYSEGRPTIVFVSGVHAAERVAAILNGDLGVPAAAVVGDTPDDRRRLAYRRFEEGDLRVLVGCDVFTEGFDSPTAACLINAQIGKSVGRYIQKVGRVARPLRGVLDSLHEATAEERRAAIAASGKSDALLVDINGAADGLDLASSASIWDGEFSEAALERAVRKAKKADGGGDIRRLAAEAEAELRAEAEEARLRLEYKLRSSESAAPVGRSGDQYRRTDDPPTKPQADLLRKWGYDPDRMSKRQASNLINVEMKRLDAAPASVRQQEILADAGYQVNDGERTISVREASMLLDIHFGLPRERRRSLREAVLAAFLGARYEVRESGGMTFAEIDLGDTKVSTQPSKRKVADYRTLCDSLAKFMGEAAHA